MRPRFRLPVSLTVALQSLAAVALTGCTPDSAVSPDATPPTAGVTSKQATTSGRILYVSFSAAGSELRSMDDDGTDHRTLFTALQASVVGASWAPDGKRIAFSAPVDGSTGHAIHTIEADGTGLTTLTVPTPGCADTWPVSLGKQVVFVRRCTATTSLLVMNADGSAITTLEPNIDLSSAGASPKGGFVAYAKDGDIWLLDVTAGTRTNLTNTPTLFEASPAFSPSGKRILFVRDNQPATSILTMDIDGTMVSSVLVDPGHTVTSPKWSPDGRSIVFAMGFETGNFITDVFVIGATGTGLTNLTRTSNVRDYAMAWARD